MADYRLSITQRNEVFKIAVRLGLDPASFEWQEHADSLHNVVHRIIHPSTGSFFSMSLFITSVASKFRLDYWPRTVDLEWPYTKDWNGLREQIAIWLGAVKLESSAVDLWQVARAERAWLGATEADFRQNTPFTDPEREQIARHLRTIEEYTIKTYQLEEADHAHVRQQLQYLTEAASRVGRFDWKNLAASTFIDIVLTLGLDVEKAQRLMALATHLLGPLVLGISRLLLPQ